MLKRIMLMGGAFFFVLGGVFFFSRPIEYTEGEISQDIYIWQRRWQEEIRASLEKSASRCEVHCALAAEIVWRSSSPLITRVPIEYSWFLEKDLPLAIALRVGAYSGSFDENSKATQLLLSISKTLIGEAQKAGVSLVELQLDFDCAESKLEGYANWVRYLSKSIDPIPLVITVLPSWLKRRSFGQLIESTESYVLQVHSLKRPRSIKEIEELCPIEKAQGWVKKAASWQKKYRVALPTYSYLLAFSSEGNFLGLSADGTRLEWEQGSQLSRLDANPESLSQLMAQWKKRRPRLMQGIIWYRLPVLSDRFNWHWTTLESVMEGKIPEKKLEVEVDYPLDGLAEVTLVNSGERSLSPTSLILSWEEGSFLGGDGLQGYTLFWKEKGKAHLDYQKNPSLLSIRPQEHKKVAWLRFTQKTKVQVYVSTILD